MRELLRPAFSGLLVFTLSVATATLAADFPLDSVPPTDPAVRTGTLPNGMRYYVMRNAKPEKHVELRLAVKVGSVQETEEERGLAHFNEHMNFNGTKNFAPGEIVSYLESIGARFGADSNAYTNYDETVYMLTVPTEKQGALEKALTIMADWAGAATLSAVEIEKERGVVLDELRGNKGAGKRIRDKQDQLFFKGSRYADRLTIGLESVLSGAAPEVVQGFYRKWYHPDVMAVIVVGDFDADDMERRVEALFGAIPAAAKPTDLPVWPVPAHDETYYSFETDAELRANTVRVHFQRPAQPLKTVGDLRRETVRQAASGLLSMRLSERAQTPDPPFLGAGAGSYDYVKSLAVFSVSAGAKDGEIPRAATAVMDELERARKHGFLAEELDRIKTATLTYAENQLKESAETRSGDRADGIVQAFLNDVTVTSDQWDHDLTVALIPGLTLDEVNASLREMSDGRSRVVLAQAPKKDGVAAPTVDQLKDAIEPATAREVAAYVDDLAGKKLIDEEPAGGKVVERVELPEVGVEKITLTNGVQVYWKKTDFRADQVFMRGFAQGGAADYGPSVYASAIRADTLALESGLADFTRPQLQKWMAGSGRIGTAGPNVSRFLRGFEGNCRPADFDLMVQMTWLYFTRPAFRDDAFDRMVDEEVQGIKNQLNSPGGVYGRAFDEAATDGHWLYAPPSVADVKALKKAELERLYREMFDDGSEWTFVMVGNFDPAAHVPLIERWLGAIPTKSTTPRTTDPDLRYRDLGLHFPTRGGARGVHKGIEDQSRTNLLLDAPHQLNPQNVFDIDAVTDLLEIRLRDKLREEKGETYGASAGIVFFPPYRDYGRIQISFTGSPDTREGMVADVKDVIRWMKMTMPSTDDVKKLREMRFNELAVAEKENGYWLSGISNALTLGRDPRTMLQRRHRIERLDARSLWLASKRWLDLDDVVEVFLVPENWSPSRKKIEPIPTTEPAEAPAPVGT